MKKPGSAAAAETEARDRIADPRGGPDGDRPVAEPMKKPTE